MFNKILIFVLSTFIISAFSFAIKDDNGFVFFDTKSLIGKQFTNDIYTFKILESDSIGTTKTNVIKKDNAWYVGINQDFWVYKGYTYNFSHSTWIFIKVYPSNTINTIYFSPIEILNEGKLNHKSINQIILTPSNEIITYTKSSNFYNSPNFNVNCMCYPLLEKSFPVFGKFDLNLNKIYETPDTVRILDNIKLNEIKFNGSYMTAYVSGIWPLTNTPIQFITLNLTNGKYTVEEKIYTSIINPIKHKTFIKSKISKSFNLQGRTITTIKPMRVILNKGELP